MYLEQEDKNWIGLQRAVMRRDLFWVFFYADQLATFWAIKKASQLPEKVIEG